MGNIWFVYSVFALMILPVTMVAITVLKPAEALAPAPTPVLLKIVLHGAGWGIGHAQKTRNGPGKQSGPVLEVLEYY
jgi:hypothetical protein